MTQATGIAPITDDSSQTFWDACAESKLLYQICDQTGEPQFYPRGFSLSTLGTAVSWAEASGRAKLHTFSIVHRTSDVRFTGLLPYVLAVVELEEGPRMMSRIVNCVPESLSCDQPLRVVFEDMGGYHLPLFEPEKADQ